MTDLITARGLGKSFGSTRALDGVSFTVEPGRIVGLIGPNGAGKTTALKALLGLTRFEGQLSVLGLDPYRQRHQLMQDVCFIADVAVLPRWIRVSQLIDFVAATHPRFRREVCEHFLGRSDVRKTSRVRELSKGMVTQLHLARSKRGCTPATNSIASLTLIQRGSTATSAMKQTSRIRSSRWVRGSRPRTDNWPSNGMRPSMALSAVVLPAPFGPIRPTMRPPGISNAVLSSATLFL